MIDFPWEDNLLERKVESDLKDLLKTLVAFSNSVKPGHVATILIGEKDDGTVQGVKNPDNIQKRIRKECDKIYPPILWRSMIYKKMDKFCVRIEIEHDGDTPHFGGPAWVRQGSETVIATEQVFQQLVDLRSDIVSELAKWLGKKVTVHGDTSTVPVSRREESIGARPMIHLFSHRWAWDELAEVVFINNYWVTFDKLKIGKRVSEPLSKITLSFDDENDRLRVIVGY
ncbi:helix-turn-helix domain-containing protein [Candidatus Leptofilum sp.]|uniref:AlbA family DNA-binding domain-containing protein n=1 Tax=Candidatus Leptofilum sp. TaxID=3241576 RepID=UPI003B5C6C26